MDSNSNLYFFEITSNNEIGYLYSYNYNLQQNWKQSFAGVKSSYLNDLNPVAMSTDGNITLVYSTGAATYVQMISTSGQTLKSYSINSLTLATKVSIFKNYALFCGQYSTNTSSACYSVNTQNGASVLIANNYDNLLGVDSQGNVIVSRNSGVASYISSFNLFGSQVWNVSMNSGSIDHVFGTIGANDIIYTMQMEEYNYHYLLAIRNGVVLFDLKLDNSDNKYDFKRTQMIYIHPDGSLIFLMHGFSVPTITVKRYH